MLANGCFWCSGAIFKRLKGVKSVLPGYLGGKVKNPSYEQVCTGRTGHAESIQIDLIQKSYLIKKSLIFSGILMIRLLSTLNRQGNDIGTQYRSAIFYHDQKQKEIAEKSKSDLEKAGVYKNPIVTEITPFKDFYVAEHYHKNYYESHREAPYCNFVIDPKLHKLIAKYGSDLKDKYDLNSKNHREV